MRYQKQGSTHIKEHGRQKEFLAMLKIAQQKKGDHLVQFLKDCKCTDWKDPNGNHQLQDCGTISKYERSKYRFYRGREIFSGDTDYTAVSPILQEYTNKLMTGYKANFIENQEVLQLLEVFDPLHMKKRMPRNEQVKIRQLGALLNIKDYKQFIRLWPKFREDLMKLPIFCNNKDDGIFTNPEKFWAHVLNSDKIQIDGPIKELLQTILVIPLGR